MSRQLQPSPSPAPDVSDLTLLVVGNGPLQAPLLQAIERRGLDVECVEPGHAVEMCRAAAPDLVMLVGRAATSGGQALVHAFRNDPDLAHTRLLVVAPTGGPVDDGTVAMLDPGLGAERLADVMLRVAHGLVLEPGADATLRDLVEGASHKAPRPRGGARPGRDVTLKAENPLLAPPPAAGTAVPGAAPAVPVPAALGRRSAVSPAGSAAARARPTPVGAAQEGAVAPESGPARAGKQTLLGLPRADLEAVLIAPGVVKGQSQASAPPPLRAQAVVEASSPPPLPRGGIDSPVASPAMAASPHAPLTSLSALLSPATAGKAGQRLYTAPRSTTAPQVQVPDRERDEERTANVRLPGRGRGPRDREGRTLAGGHGVAEMMGAAAQAEDALFELPQVAPPREADRGDDAARAVTSVEAPPIAPAPPQAAPAVDAALALLRQGCAIARRSLLASTARLRAQLPARARGVDLERAPVGFATLVAKCVAAVRKASARPARATALGVLGVAALGALALWAMSGNSAIRSLPQLTVPAGRAPATVRSMATKVPGATPPLPPARAGEAVPAEIAAPSRTEHIKLANAAVEQGHRMLKRRRLAHAKAAYLQALAHLPNYPRALAGLARVSIAARKGGEAVEWAKRLVHHRSRSSTNQLLLGDAYQLNGDQALAKQAYRTAASYGSKAAKRRLVKAPPNRKQAGAHKARKPRRR